MDTFLFVLLYQLAMLAIVRLALALGERMAGK